MSKTTNPTKRVRMLTALCGRPSCQEGGVVELPSHEADRFIAQGRAEAVEARKGDAR